MSGWTTCFRVLWYTMTSMERLGITFRRAAVGAFAFLVSVLPAHAAGLENPLGVENVNLLIGRIIRAGFGVIGAIALLMFVYGGFVWLTSGGSPDRVKKGRDAMLWAVLGIAVVFTAYAITSYIIAAIASTS